MKSNIIVNDTFFIKFHNTESDLYSAHQSYIMRNNVESLNIICNWLIDYHESTSSAHGNLNFRDSEAEDQSSSKLINKLNIIISLHSDRLDIDSNMLNCEINSGYIIPESPYTWEGESSGLIEIFVTKFINRSILIKCLFNADSNRWDLDINSEQEIELFEKMLFLINRNNL